MLVFNEGLPRSGKSHDGVKNHVIPALKAGRKVYARINGLDHARIAEYLGVEEARVRELLVLVSSATVRTLFLAKRDISGPDQDWFIADELKNALFIVDEAHEFYVAGRNAINPAIEQFFALCGQNGMDGVLMSQWYRRLHSSVRARVERKNVFQKLTAVGLTSRYTVTRYHATAPDRFEKVATETAEYDAKIFPLYKGYADGAANTEVYKAGGVTVWRKIALYSAVMLPLVGFGTWSFLHFFGSDSGLVKSAAVRPVDRVAQVAPVKVSAPAAGSVVPKVEAKPKHGKMDDGQGYVFDLIDKGRARLAGVVRWPGRDDVGLVEFRDGGGVVESLTLAQLRELGVSVEVHGYGVRLRVGEDSRIVTAWPLPVEVVASDMSSASPQTAAVPPSSAPAVPAGVTGTDYKREPVRAAYVPPEAMPHPERSSWRPSAG